MEITQEDFDMIQADYERVQMEYGEMLPTEENEIIQQNVKQERESTQALMEFVSQTQSQYQIEITQESIEMTQGNEIEQPVVNKRKRRQVVCPRNHYSKTACRGLETVGTNSEEETKELD
jgi:hypothetical protein